MAKIEIGIDGRKYLVFVNFGDLAFWLIDQLGMQSPDLHRVHVHNFGGFENAICLTAAASAEG